MFLLLVSLLVLLYSKQEYFLLQNLGMLPDVDFKSLRQIGMINQVLLGLVDQLGWVVLVAAVVGEGGTYADVC